MCNDSSFKKSKFYENMLKNNFSMSIWMEKGYDVKKMQQWRRLSLYVILECISTHLLSTYINIPLYSIYE